MKRNDCLTNCTGHPDGGKENAGRGLYGLKSCAEQRLCLKNPALHAGLTIEAALALPLFMYFCTAVIYLLVIISLQSDIQLAMEEAARSLGKEAYLLDEADADSLLGYAAIRAAVFDSALEDEIDNSGIKNGVSGVSTLLSGYDDESGILDIVLTYTYNIPFLPDSISGLKFIQRVRSRVWIGQELDGSKAQTDGGRIVYITPSGTVYHTTVKCPYLDLSISSVDFSSVSSLRNKSGSKYTACTACCKKSTYTSVYITDYGTSYHASLSCSKLKRTVLAVDISEVGNRKACSRCGD